MAALRPTKWGYSMLQRTKACTDCGEVKSLDNFYRNASCKDGHIGTCKACKARQQRVRRAARAPDTQRYIKEAARRRENHLKSTYGITEEEYSRMYTEQGGVCAICKQPEPISGRSLCVDHSHTTGDVRGLLCSNCNRGIGLLQDSVELVRNAYHYLTGKL